MSTCRDCDFVCSDTRKLTPYKWRCLRSPQQLRAPIGLEYVDPDWRPDPPYALCMNRRDLHQEDCPDFSPRREAPKGDA